MKALTIWQPWASLIMAGAKPYEFRGWRAHRSLIGHRIVIHASARKIVRREVLSIIERLDSDDFNRAGTCLHRGPAMPILEAALAMTMRGADGSLALPLSAGLGTAILGEPRNGYDIAEEFGLPRVNDSDRDEHANWGWPLTNIEIWDGPIPMKGAQGFWNWPEPKDFGL